MEIGRIIVPGENLSPHTKSESNQTHWLIASVAKQLEDLQLPLTVRHNPHFSPDDDFASVIVSDKASGTDICHVYLDTLGEGRVGVPEEDRNESDPRIDLINQHLQKRMAVLLKKPVTIIT